MLHCPNIGGKQPHPQHLLRKIKLEWFLHCSKEHQNMRTLDHAFTLLRMTPARLFSVDFLRNAPQKMRGWTAYHAIVTSNTNIRKTNIGYCPMVPASATEFNIVYTVMIYLQAMGGMHRTMNFMGDIRHIMQESGFEDVLVEANVYGASVVNYALRGKAYNRGVRIHKIMHESMSRLKWMGLADSIKNSDLSQDKRTRFLIKGAGASRFLRMWKKHIKTTEELLRMLFQNS